MSYEPYLELLNHSEKRCIAKLRASNHRLNCETGRYLPSKNSPSYNNDKENMQWRKSCKTCCADEAKDLSHLPFYSPIIEDEHHVLATCPMYHHLRLDLNDEIKSWIVTWDACQLKHLFDAGYIRPFAKYIKKIFAIRFPKDEKSDPPDLA